MHIGCPPNKKEGKTMSRPHSPPPAPIGHFRHILGLGAMALMAIATGAAGGAFNAQPEQSSAKSLNALPAGD